MNTLILQGYMRQALDASGALKQLIGDRVFDQPPPDQSFPYIVLGLAGATDMSTSDCVTDWEVIAQIDVFSRAVGFPECKRIAEACDEALAERHPVIEGIRMGFFESQGHRFLREPDGITSHGVLEYRARYGPAD